MTINQTLTHIRAHYPMLTAGYVRETREFRIAPKFGSREDRESAAYYTNDSADAISTAHSIAPFVENKHGELL